MTRHFLHKLWPLALLAALVLTACGGSSNQPVDQPSSGGTVQKATATVSVQFPQQALAKALIDDRTTRIQLQYYSLQGGYYSWLGSVDLTPANPTAVVEVPIGPVTFEAIAFRFPPTSGFEIEMARASTAGEIVGGNTNITLRFLLGDWQFVDANDNPLPLVMNSSSGTVAVQGFSLNTPNYYYPAQGVATRAAIDWTKPIGWAGYSVRWFKDDGAGNPVPFGNPDWGSHASQFVSNGTTTTTSTAVDTDGVVLDTPVPMGPPIGKRIAFLTGTSPTDGSPNDTITGSNGQDLVPLINQYADSRDLDGTTMAGHLIEMTYVDYAETITQTGADCSLYWSQVGAAASPAAARAKAVQNYMATSAKVHKAAPGDATVIDAGTITSVYTDCRINYQDGDGDGDFYQDYLYIDVNGNGLYDPLDGDLYDDYNMDGNYDWVINPPLVDGDGDGDFSDDYLSYDANFNGRLDPGDTFYDYDNDGVFDFTYDSGDMIDVTEHFSNAVAREYRAKASFNGTLFQPVAVSNPYIQYRTYENSANNRFQGWIQYSSDGQNIDPSEITQVQLFDPSGAELFAAPQPTFYATKYLNATWNGSQFGTTTSTGYSGYSFNLSGYASLPGGDYTFVTTLSNGREVTTMVNFPGQVAVPVVSSTTMNYTWNGDGSLTLNWSEPAGTFGTYRVVLTSPATGLEIFYGVANPGTTSVTLSATLLQDILTNAGLPVTAPVNWVMQTRNFTGTVNTSRGYSNPVPISAPGASGSAVGTWIRFDPINSTVTVIGILDASNYLFGEDGIADVGGGPGMERGTYVMDTGTGDTTFTAAFETNGDWGPATVGIPGMVNITVSGDILTVFDPVTFDTFDLSRVTLDPLSAVVGAWYFNISGFESLLVLLSNGQYFVAEGMSTDLPGSHFEHGTYTWNSTNGALSATGVFNSNASVAIAAPGVTNSNITATVSGNTLTWTDTSGTYTATRR